jgi:aspartate racemase
MPRHKLGVIGGLGPLATAVFLERVVQMTDAASDQEHLDAIIYSFPSIPDRTRFILGQSQDSPVGPMQAIGRRLVEQGATRIAIPCITAHYFFSELAAAIRCPLIHMIRETAAHLSNNGVRTAGITATDGTLAGRVFQNELDAFNIRSVVPSAISQRYLMQLIYDNIKAGLPPDLDNFAQVTGELRRNGAEAIIIGCTELSLIQRSQSLGAGFLDAMDVLAMASVRDCGYPLKRRYLKLIT